MESGEEIQYASSCDKASAVVSRGVRDVRAGGFRGACEEI
jgi:hypothetical protein